MHHETSPRASEITSKHVRRHAPEMISSAQPGQGHALPGRRFSIWRQVAPARSVVCLCTARTKSIGFYDAGAERFYHGLALGLIALVDDRYRIRSNRESGEGRYDYQFFRNHIQKDVESC